MTQIIPFDFETTSAQPATARVVQTAWLSYKDNEIQEEFVRLSNPGVSIHHEAEKVHGISNEMVKDKPSDEVVVSELGTYIAAAEEQGDIILAGHNSLTFDLPILERMTRTDFWDIPHIDTLVLSQRTFLDAPNHKLSDLTVHLGLGDGSGAHDALEDIRMVLKLIGRLSEVHGKTAQELAEWTKTPCVLKTCGIGKHKGKPWGQEKGCVPWFFVNWMVDNWDNASLDMQATILHHYGKRFKFRGAMKVLPPNTEFLL